MFSKLSEGGWDIGIRKGTPGMIIEDQKTPFELIPNSWRSWAADPFVVEYQNTVYVFAELFDYLKRRGSIGYTCLENGKWRPWKVVIDEPFHMSYPNVFERDGKYYMIPETSADRTLRLYQAVSFPNQWKLERVIASDVAYVDTTFFHWNDTVYAITTDISNHPQQRDLLLQFDADWNIISSGEIREERTELSRCAGNFLLRKDGMIRVSQNCDGHYGKALVFSKVGEAGVRNGLGDIVQQLGPFDLSFDDDKNWTGLHTYNYTGTYEVVDVERNHYTLVGTWGRCWSKLKLLLGKA